MFLVYAVGNRRGVGCDGSVASQHLKKIQNLSLFQTVLRVGGWAGTSGVFVGTISVQETKTKLKLD